VRPNDHGITVDPFPLGLEQLTLTGVRVRGRTLEVRIVGDKFTVIAGGDRIESTLGEAVELEG
jgi:ASC-1-like (ASCH) protein